MTQEEKALLLKDLSGRLPYGVMYETEYGPRIINDLFIYSNGPVYTDHAVGEYNQIYGVELQHIKPYLRPMSSMTEEERNKFNILWENDWDRALGNQIENEWDKEGYENDTKRLELIACANAIDWLNSHHFDHRGLIPMGLALEAKEGMYKTE